MLHGKCGVVTGAAGGIGRSTAVSWAKNGAKVVCADIDLDGAQETVKIINELGFGKIIMAVAVQADVSSKDDTLKVLDACVNNFGSIQIFFANAGVLPGNRSIAEQDEAEFMRTIQINMFGVFLGIKYSSIYMKKYNKDCSNCSIVCTGSIAAIRADLTPLAYTASKGGILSMAQSANDQFLLDGIRVNSIVPGGVNTQIYWSMARKLEEQGLVMKGFDFKRFPPLEPEDIANVVTFLVSDLSKAIKGQVIVADGGMSQSMGSQPYPSKINKKKAKL